MAIKLLKRLIRIYTPFICTLIALIHGVLFLTDSITDDFQFNASAYFGFSAITVIFFWATANRMCIWWHLNLVCLFLIIVAGLLYYYNVFNFNVYIYTIILLATLGLIFFIIYRVTVGITKILC